MTHPFSILRVALALGLSVAVLTGAAQAQQVIKFSPEATVACIAQAKTEGTRMDCVGTSAKACFNRIKGRSTGDIAACMAQETNFWQRRMDKALDAMREKAKAEDAAFMKTAKAKYVPFKLTEDLETMQERWAAFREARCAVEAMMRRGTRFTSTAAASCVMQETARQAMFLETAVAYQK
ncbi:lysozyme inhibitor LprI family protein [Rhodalgimonas zhirmunskyi]|uniref:DUF1311 domain-containing protein n=1 Tax=Rhodalgimonas zhirmunskyi TaxID=2964767 RepID=A0AAJ1X8A0_9RHOB|nr:lysozyme inhibitor LprI family protein [Rhodoalgimonas zhirmunskyi]MDQ2095392.1 DUF1311 domain-containing protein [Rhodoalgimonas zhirmunskyi]